jgi:hypothetical protein
MGKAPAGRLCIQKDVLLEHFNRRHGSPFGRATEGRGYDRGGGEIQPPANRLAPAEFMPQVVARMEEAKSGADAPFGEVCPHSAALHAGYGWATGSERR